MVFVILGTLIGAGFASGQEIYLFFYRFGSAGIVGFVLSSVLLSAIIYKVLKISYIENLQNYRTLIEKILPSEQSADIFATHPTRIFAMNPTNFLKTHSDAPERKYFNAKTIINNIVNLFILICFFIMIAGFGAYLKEQFGIPSILGSAILATACFFVLQKNIEGVIKVNKIIVPFLIAFLVLIGILSISTRGGYNTAIVSTSRNSNGWLINSIIYAGYNSILLIPVLINLARTQAKSIFATSVASGSIATLLGLIIFVLLSTAGPVVGDAEMPVAQALKSFSEPVQFAYALIILSSIFTTSISLGNSFLANTLPVSKLPSSKQNTNTSTASSNHYLYETNISKRKYAQHTFALCLAATLFSNVGFANLITYTYPIFGVFGTIQAIAIFTHHVSQT